MPPKVDLKTLNTNFLYELYEENFLYELYEESQVVINVQPELELIVKIYKEIESKYRGFKKQVEVIEDRIIENQIPPEDPVVIAIRASTKAKSDYLKCTQSFAAYQRNCLDAKAKVQKHDQEHVAGHLENVNTALQKMVDVWIVRAIARIMVLRSCQLQHGMEIENHMQLGKTNLTIA